MKVLDNLQHVQELNNKISDMKDNFNELQRKYHTALNEIELIKITPDREKQLLHAITVANRATKKAIKQRDSERDRIHDLKRNYGVI